MKPDYKLEVLWCRVFQGILKIGNYVMGYRMPEYLEGAGKLRELGAFLREKGINDVLVVTGSGMVRRGQVQPMLESFEKAGIRYALQSYDTTDPTSDDVELGYRTYREKGCKAIVAIGGGSASLCNRQGKGRWQGGGRFWECLMRSEFARGRAPGLSNKRAG